MNSVEKKELIKAITEVQTSRKIKEKHINYLLQKIEDLGLGSKLIKAIK